ncbi:MAG: heme exporter protein CcmB [Persicimonas sp.]
MNPTFFRQTAALVKKDLRRELRTGETLVTTTAFSVLLMVIFAFAFYRDEQTVALVFPGILWVAVVFAGMLAIARTFAREKESGSLRALALVPRTQTSLYCAKLVVNLLFMAVFEAVLVPFLLVAFEVDLGGQLGALIAILAAGTIGFAALGTLISAMLVYNRMRDVLLPLVLFPLYVPLLIGGVRATMLILEGDRHEAVWGWARVMLAIDGVFIIGALLLFRWVLSAIE